MPSNLPLHSHQKQQSKRRSCTDVAVLLLEILCEEPLKSSLQGSLSCHLLSSPISQCFSQIWKDTKHHLNGSSYRAEELSTDKKPAINSHTIKFFQMEIVDGIKNWYQLIFCSDPKLGSDFQYCLAKSVQLEGMYVSSPNKYFHAFQVSVIASSLFPCSFLLSEWVYGYMCLLKIKGISSYWYIYISDLQILST